MEDELRALLERVDPETPRVVVRWADEQRIMPEPESAYTVHRVVYATITARVDGAPVQQTIEGLELDVIKRIVAEYKLAALYRSDNITR